MTHTVMSAQHRHHFLKIVPLLDFLKIVPLLAVRQRSCRILRCTMDKVTAIVDMAAFRSEQLQRRGQEAPSQELSVRRQLQNGRALLVSTVAAKRSWLMALQAPHNTICVLRQVTFQPFLAHPPQQWLQRLLH